MKRYIPSEIEPKWQGIWEETGIYTTDLNSNKPKYIAMSMFNYPSGTGIHIGHAMNYTISDVKARFKRQQGFESYHPVGWDAFGLPAENYAIKAGISPQTSMAQIIPLYHKQYKAMGWSNDWEKEIATHLPEYYGWTQWIFEELYKHGLVYMASRLQWWCDIDKTVLANEQVIDGKCWRHDGPNDPFVTKREVKQWFFKITDYADELLEAIDDLDWSESVKLAQVNWIGKSIGAEIDFKVKDRGEVIKVFTTALDTIYGATFMVLAPENELVGKLTTKEHESGVKTYVIDAEKKTEIDRQAGKNKTGVFTGSYAIHPLTGKQIPIWVADYVLEGYGTGAIMAVPGSDERDYEFALNNKLDIIYITKEQKFISYADIKEEPTKFTLTNSDEFDDLTFKETKEKILDRLVKLGIGQKKVNYRMLDWSVSRQRYWGAPIPIIHCLKCGQVLVPEKDLPVILPEITNYQPTGDGRSALARASDWLKVDCPKCGGLAERETDTLDTYIDSSWYMYRYFDPHNQEKIFDPRIVKKWEPIDFYNGADHATAHLLYARFLARFFTKIGLVNKPEPFKQFLFNGKVTASDGTMFSKSKGNGVDPLEIIANGYGADALRVYLMFAAPLDLWVKWDPKGVPGAYRFLNRLWNLCFEYSEAKEGDLTPEISLELKRVINPMIKKVTEDIENNRYNTAISAIMTALNDLYKLKVKYLKKNKEWQEALEAVVACTAPFAPHIAEELWQQLGHSQTIHIDSWPKWEDEYLITEKVTVVVQVNGKLRAKLELKPGASKDEAEKDALANELIKKHIENREVIKVIFVPDKLINIVTR
jgi:leucyl-tRNA synthetase